ncbi:MAG: hypothetical protein HC904_02925 [Blastochloris sp.]|nr:hypothetical protein [Blastochloris sp.]
MTDFEKKLQQLEPLSAPSDLRDRILRACSREEESNASACGLLSWLRLLYPGHAWSLGFAALWLLVLALHLDTPERTVPSGPTLSWIAWKEMQKEQILLLAQLETPRFEVNLQQGSFALPKEDL